MSLPTPVSFTLPNTNSTATAAQNISSLEDLTMDLSQCYDATGTYGVQFSNWPTNPDGDGTSDAQKWYETLKWTMTSIGLAGPWMLQFTGATAATIGTQTKVTIGDIPRARWCRFYTYTAGGASKIALLTGAPTKGLLEVDVTAPSSPGNSAAVDISALEDLYVNEEYAASTGTFYIEFSNDDVASGNLATNWFAAVAGLATSGLTAATFYRVKGQVFNPGAFGGKGTALVWIKRAHWARIATISGGAGLAKYRLIGKTR